MIASMTDEPTPNTNNNPSGDFKVIGYDETDRVSVPRKSGETAELDIPNGAELISRTLVAALEPGRVANWISCGTSAIGHRIELAKQDDRLIARSCMKARWSKMKTVDKSDDNLSNLKCLFVTQQLEFELKPNIKTGDLNPQTHLVFMPRRILLKDGVEQNGTNSMNDGKTEHNIWKRFESELNKGNRDKRILLLTAQVLRDADFRLREDGSTSAAVEDAWSIIAGSESGLANMNEKVGARARMIFETFGHIFVRIRADAVIHFRHVDETNVSQVQWVAELYYAKGGERSEWLRQRDAVFGLDAILAGSVALAIKGGFSKEVIERHLKMGVERMNNLIQRGYAEAEADDDKNHEKTMSEIWRISTEKWIAQEGGIGELIWKRSSPNRSDEAKGDEPSESSEMEKAVGESKSEVNEKDGASSGESVLTINIEIGQGALRGSWDLFGAACAKVKKDNAHGMAEEWERVCLDVSMEIVDKGPDKMSNKRVFKLGKLKSFDRNEVDGLAGLWRLMSTYLQDTKHPLSVGVFGAPGSGKSFAVKEVAASVLSQMPGKSEEPLEFNVAQFTSLGDLAKAFHKARDRFLSTSRVPVVIFDEFDAAFGGRPFGWLQYFLMPMQDGKFKDDGEVFHTGKGIFIFCGGLNRTFDEFSSRQRDQEFCSAKGPDFISRLRGILNIPSLDRPDQPEEEGEIPKWMIRRAMLLNYQLGEHKAKILDPAVRRAFLKVPYYRHGARSLEAIIDMCARQPSGVIDRTSLPRRDQIELHTDAAAFWEIIREYSSLREPTPENRSSS